MEYVKGIKKDVILAKYSAYQIGGPADYFFVAKNRDDLEIAMNFANDNNLPVFVLAGGTNILFSDEGFRGLIIKIENKNLEIEENKITAGAGVMMDDLVAGSINIGLEGLEWAGGLPGTLGGAIRGNAGCFGGEIKNIVKEVSTVTPGGELKNYSDIDCRFSYRDSIFKTNGEIILSAMLSLNSGDKEKLRAEAFSHIKYRQERQPLEFPNCGSVFKNCPLNNVPLSIQERFKEKIKNDPFPIMPAAVLIGNAGLKGLAIGGARVSEKHPNFIVNTGNAAAADIITVISEVKDRVKSEFGVILNEEIELVGF